MNIVVINGSNRLGNKTMRVSRVAEKIARDMGFNTSFVNLITFTKLFNHEYILAINSSEPYQNRKLYEILHADLILFVTPLSYTTPPLALMNFIELTKLMGLYDNKVIGSLIVSNSMDMNLPLTNILTDLFEDDQPNTLVLSKISVINYEKIEFMKVEKYISYCTKFIEAY